MYLPDSLSRPPFLDDCWFFLPKLSQFCDGFLTFPKIIRLIVDILKLIYFANIRYNKQERERISRGIFFLGFSLHVSFISSSRRF